MTILDQKNMSENLNRNYLHQLQQLNLHLRVHLEEAEVRVPEINDQIQQLYAIELVPETALLGTVICVRDYSILNGAPDSSQVFQSALLIPGGLGVILWDCEDYLNFRNGPSVDQKELFLKFVPFDLCDSAVKALLLPHIEPLLRMLFKQLPAM